MRKGLLLSIILLITASLILASCGKSADPDIVEATIKMCEENDIKYETVEDVNDIKISVSIEIPSNETCAYPEIPALLLTVREYKTMASLKEDFSSVQHNAERINNTLNSLGDITTVEEVNKEAHRKYLFESENGAYSLSYRQGKYYFTMVSSSPEHINMVKEMVSAFGY